MNPPAAVRHDRLDGFAVAAMIGLTMTWGFNQVAIKIGNGGFNPLAVAVFRAALASLLVALWCRYRGIPLFDRDGALVAGIVAGVLFGAEFALIFIGLDLTTAARGVLMVNTMPFFVAAGAHLWLGERLTSLKLVGMALAFSGVALVFSDKLSLPDSRALIGDGLMLGAAALWAATTLVIKGSRLSAIAAEKVLLYQLAVSAVVTAPFVGLAGPLMRAVAPLPIAAVLFQAMFVVAFTYVVWFGLMRRYPASALSNFAFLSPAFGVLSGGLLLGEPLTWRLFAALALIGLGLYIAGRAKR
ncbi:MAG: DMT family transporter [Phyllobacteriaceae bacterium]|nr:DMT family transporter [Phyllobacteriaceae bacterium]